MLQMLRVRPFCKLMSKCYQSDSDGHESENTAMQVMSTDTESCATQDIDRYIEDTEYLNL